MIDKVGIVLYISCENKLIKYACTLLVWTKTSVKAYVSINIGVSVVRSDVRNARVVRVRTCVDIRSMNAACLHGSLIVLQNWHG